jgi:hypothetical protein
MPNLEETYAQAPGVVAREFDGETVLLRVAGSVADMRALYVLNATGTLIWERLDGARPMHAIVDDLVARYEVLADAAAVDTLALIDSLLAADLVERRPGP